MNLTFGRPLKDACLPGVKIYDSYKDFLSTTGFAPRWTAEKPDKYWVDASRINNPASLPVRENKYTGLIENGYLVPAIDIYGSLILPKFRTENVNHDGKVTSITQLGLNWQRYTANQVRAQFYRDYEGYFPDGVPYLEPLEDQMIRVLSGIDPGIEENIPAPGDEDDYEIPFPLALHDSDLLYVDDNGELGIFSIYDFIRFFPPKRSQSKITDQQFVSSVYQTVTDSSLLVSQKAARIRELAK